MSTEYREQAIKEVAKIGQINEEKLRGFIARNPGRALAYTVTQVEARLRLEAALRPLLESHNCDDGSVDYDGTKRECDDCKPARALLGNEKEAGS